MSFITLNWAMKLALPPRTSSAKALLMVLSYRAKRTSSDRFECYPSIPYLVGATGQNRKTILSNLTKLQGWGLVSDTGRRMGKTRQVVVYRLHMRGGISTAHPQKSRKAAKTGPNMDEKRPEYSAQEAQTRDTDSICIDDLDKSFYAHAREKDGGSTAADARNGRAPGHPKAPVSAVIEDLAHLLQVPVAKGRRTSAARGAPMTDAGGDA